MSRHFAIASLFFLLASSKCLTQLAAVPSSKTGAAVADLLPSRNLDLTRADALAGLPDTSLVSYPTQCSSEGSVYLQVFQTGADGRSAYIPTTYRIAENREVTKISFPVPAGYKDPFQIGFYAGEQTVVSLLTARQQKPLGQEGASPLAYFLSLVSRGGNDSRLIELTLPFEPSKVALFASGKILVLGSDTVNFYPVLSLLASDGTVEKILNIDTNSFSSSAELKRTYGARPTDSTTFAKRKAVTGALAHAQFAPWGSEILLVQPGSRLPVLRLRDDGSQTPVPLLLPTGFLVESMLGSSTNDRWVIRTQGIDAFEMLAKGSVVENVPQQLFEINPFTGEAVAYLELKGPRPAEVVCAAHRRLTALFYGGSPTADGSNRLTYSSALR